MSTIPTFIQRPMQKSVPYKAPQAKKGAADMSESAFPALGSTNPTNANAKANAKANVSLDFKKTVMTPVQTQAQAQAPKAHVPAAPPTNPKERKHVFVTRYGDDGPEDYDGPPEEAYDEPYEEEEEEEDAEFNADIISTRRRGDKGIW